MSRALYKEKVLTDDTNGPQEISVDNINDNIKNFEDIIEINLMESYIIESYRGCLI